MKNLQFTDSELSLLTDIIGEVVCDLPYAEESGGDYLPLKRTINLEDVDLSSAMKVYDKLRKAHG